ncbi:baseplate J/gp47 family protein [uncultured Planococcus sp.]|uniref:baseplate J/gp47 family protein n=1 Tax=uncultured Planococcus sp. TaxID=337815 RepID=UPI00261F9A67|nr:baseplate J/gp47 family protein [uncultured Planococcus sp.]
MYENRSYTDIHAELLASISDEIDKREGEVAYDLTAPVAMSGESLYVELDSVLALGFADTAAGDWLERRTRELGVERKPSEQSRGIVTLTSAEAVTVPAGQRLVAQLDDGPFYFTTLADVVLNSSSADVGAQAELGGNIGNIRPGAIASFAEGTNYFGTVGASNAQPFTGGLDIEEDVSLLERYYARAQRPSTSGNASHYEEWALEIAGIERARIYPTWAGGGTVKVVLLSTEGRAPTPEKVEEVAAHIEEERPVGATVTVVPAVEQAVAVSASLTLAEGAVIEDVQTAFTEAFSTMLGAQAFADDIVRYSRVANLLLDQAGVIDYANLLVDGGTANVVLTGDEVAVAGAVTFDVAV